MLGRLGTVVRVLLTLILVWSAAPPKASATESSGLSAAVTFEGLDRFSGANRFETAVRVAEASFPGWEGVDHVVVVCGDDRATVDALSASGLVWLYSAPLLTTSAGSLPAAVRTALREIATASPGVKVHVVGGPVSVPPARIAEIGAIVGTGNVERLPYGDRYETARQVCLRMLAEAPKRGLTVPRTMLVAKGDDQAKLVDALTLSTIAARQGAPLLLVNNAVPTATRRAMDALQPTRVIAGGNGYARKLSDQFKGLDTPVAVEPEEWGGATRYGTASYVALVAGKQGWLDPNRVVLSSSLADALTGGSMFGRQGYVLLLVRPTSIPRETAVSLGAGETNPASVRVIGGTKSFDASAWNDLRMLVDPEVPLVFRLMSLKLKVYRPRGTDWAGRTGYNWSVLTEAYDQYGLGLQGAAVKTSSTITRCLELRNGLVKTETLVDAGTTSMYGQFGTPSRFVPDTELYRRSTLNQTTSTSVTYGGKTMSGKVNWTF